MLTKKQTEELFDLYLEMKSDVYPKRGETGEFDDPNNRIVTRYLEIERIITSQN